MTTRLPPFNCDLTDDHDNSHSMDDRVLSVRRILAGKAPQDAPVTVKGWVRTRRDSKAGISFVHLSDGSSFHPVQVVTPNTLPNYADEVLKLTTGCAIEGGDALIEDTESRREKLMKDAMRKLAEE
jgi:aspartyl/asparaginyl-tRNA synthetase